MYTSYTALIWELIVYACVNAQLVHVNLVFTSGDVRHTESSLFELNRATWAKAKLT